MGLDRYFSESLRGSPPYSLDGQKFIYKLDQNEGLSDWTPLLKAKVTERLNGIPWNHYVDPFNERLRLAWAEQLGLPPTFLETGPGSNYLISLLLSCLGKSKTSIIAANPSFPLYQSHCKYDDLNYVSWDLKDGAYDIPGLNKMLDDRMKLNQKAVVIFASPNNPVGNILLKETLESLLNQYPDVFFIADEAYVEFHTENYLSLLRPHKNLILLRTLSKGMASAAVRLGLVLAHPEWIREFHKLRLPFLINAFAEQAGLVLLEDKEAQNYFQSQQVETLRQRDLIWKRLASAPQPRDWEVSLSHANFFLVRFPSQQKAEEVYQTLLTHHGILTRPVGRHPALAGCLRISIGCEKANHLWTQFLIDEHCHQPAEKCLKPA